MIKIICNLNKIYCLFLILFFGYTLFGQQTNNKSSIKVLNANQTYRNQKQYPEAIVLNGDVRVQHKGAIMTCRKALLYQKQNKLFEKFKKSL